MPTPLAFKDLQIAIEHLQPELPELLGTDYPAFTAQLNEFLGQKSINLLLDLFGRYPAAHNRLLDVIGQQETEGIRGTSGLFGDVLVTRPYLYYRCENGPHVLVLRKVEKRDAAGRAFCPQHHIAMSRIRSEDLRTAIERLRPELPLLLGTSYSAFVTQLDALLRGGSDDELSKLFEDHPAAYQRLLQVLV